MADDVRIKVSVIMPCRDEVNTVGTCVDEASAFLALRNISGEVIVVDNGSSDDSARVAQNHGAIVITEDKIGYGYAIRRGLDAASGSVMIIADCDATYDFDDMEKIIDLIDDGFDMVIGDRFSGGIEKGAMTLSHRIGGVILSRLARRRFRAGINDFHCGLRGISGDALGKLEFETGGMEFATEMIAVAQKAQLRMTQTPVKLRKCGVYRRSKLNAVRDGWRHLKFILKQ